MNGTIKKLDGVYPITAIDAVVAADGSSKKLTDVLNEQKVEWTQIQQSSGDAKKIAEITIGEETTEVYAPSSGGGGGSNVSVTAITTTGTNIADITINEETTHLYAPTSGGGGGGHSYSTEEQVIGTWIDGKPLYERTYTNLGLGLSGRLEVSTGTIPNLAEIDSVINGWAVRTPHDGYSASMLALSFWRSSSTVLVLYNQSDFSNVNNLILQYTKTTD